MVLFVVHLEQARGDVVRLVHRGLGVRDFSHRAARALRRAVPFDGYCVLTVDPATLLPTGEVVANGLPAPAMARLTAIEIGEPDYNKSDALASAGEPAASLSGATEGRLDRSLRHRELRRPSGFEDELRAVLVSGTETWGALTLLRERGRPHFTAADVRCVASLVGPLAEGIRRALVLGDPAAQTQSERGVAVLVADNSVELANPAARELLDDLAPGGAEEPPIVVQAVANRARRAATDGLSRGAVARARTCSGRWLTVDGSILGDGPAARVVVVLEPAQAPALAPLIAAAYGLSERERRVTELVARGTRLARSPHSCTCPPGPCRTI